MRSNISEALTRAGFVSRAAVLIDPVTEMPFDHGRWPVHLERANLDALRGRLDAAQDRLSSLRNDTASTLVRAEIETRKELVNYAAVVDLWDGAPDRALPPLKQLLDEAVRLVSAQTASQLGQSFVLAARAAADIVEHDAPPGRARGDHLRDLMDLRSRAGVDPFTATSPADGPALGASWRAETARLSGRPSLVLWATAASEWDTLGRPHDAAYCRWRGAQVALSTGHGTIALRLLRPREPTRPASTYPSRQPSPRRPSARSGHPVPAERPAGAAGCGIVRAPGASRRSMGLRAPAPLWWLSCSCPRGWCHLPRP